MMTFKRGDIVRLKSDEYLSEHTQSPALRDEFRAYRYIVLGPLAPGFSFRVGDVNIVCESQWSLWGVSWGPHCIAMNTPSSNMIATGEVAEEVA